MSDPDWSAVLVSGNTLTVWSMSGRSPVAPPEKHAASDIDTLPGPIVAAGLSVPPRTVPSPAALETTHVTGLPHVAAIRGLCQESPVALTSGAETAIAGYVSEYPEYDGILLVLGHNTCWAHISAQEVVSFQTFLTPELARALDVPVSEIDDAFDAALSETLSRPDRLAQHLASAQAAGTGQAHAHLIGAEIAAAKPYWLGQKIVILGDDTTLPEYRRALLQQGAVVQSADLEKTILAGFAQAWADITINKSA